MKKLRLIFSAFFLTCALSVLAQAATVAPPENLVVEGVPKIPVILAETAGRYGAYRNAALTDWHPTDHALLISTRFAETPQLHLVSQPGGERRQLTFYTDAVRLGRFHPNGGDYIVFSKDIGVVARRQANPPSGRTLHQRILFLAGGHGHGREDRLHTARCQGWR